MHSSRGIASPDIEAARENAITAERSPDATRSIDTFRQVLIPSNFILVQRVQHMAAKTSKKAAKKSAKKATRKTAKKGAKKSARKKAAKKAK
jgi:hypothetical protein